MTKKERNKEVIILLNELIQKFTNKEITEFTGVPLHYIYDKIGKRKGDLEVGADIMDYKAKLDRVAEINRLNSHQKGKICKKEGCVSLTKKQSNRNKQMHIAEHLNNPFQLINMAL